MGPGGPLDLQNRWGARHRVPGGIVPLASRQIDSPCPYRGIHPGEHSSTAPLRRRRRLEPSVPRPGSQLPEAAWSLSGHRCSRRPWGPLAISAEWNERGVVADSGGAVGPEASCPTRRSRRQPKSATTLAARSLSFQWWHRSGKFDIAQRRRRARGVGASPGRRVTGVPPNSAQLLGPTSDQGLESTGWTIQLPPGRVGRGPTSPLSAHSCFGMMCVSWPQSTVAGRPSPPSVPRSRSCGPYGTHASSGR